MWQMGLGKTREASVIRLWVFSRVRGYMDLNLDRNVVERSVLMIGESRKFLILTKDEPTDRS